MDEVTNINWQSFSEVNFCSELFPSVLPYVLFTQWLVLYTYAML